MLLMDDYEVANLQRLLLAAAAHTGEQELCVKTWNTGDWLMQIANNLPPVKVQPNLPYPPDDRLTPWARRLLGKPQS
jgi:hypothetical protein